ncbi:acyltransferase domain-containing protein [Thermobifida alba]|uniref:Acyltransferase domain-containing protein n=2 Tax=Thermobifida alba TaxID=53522 RepID=A0ABY4L7L9_THEAE|nr:acyltransferase domain-containing protein [Thermobifida alba]
MAAGLCHDDHGFTNALDEAFEAMGPQGEHLRAEWRAARPRLPIDHATRSQPLLFAVDYALARMVEGWGVRPSALLGHSLGELVAAVLAGVFGLADAARVVVNRSHEVAQAPPGRMLATAASPADIAPLLVGGAVIGAVNAPRQTVVAGTVRAVEATRGMLAGAGITHRAVPSLTAFHSPVLRRTRAHAARAFASIPASPPRIPLYSCYTAARLSAGEARDPAYWADHVTAPVRFWDALCALLSTSPYLLVEAGPGQALSRLARLHPDVRAGRSAVVPLLPARSGPPSRDREAARRARRLLEAEGIGGPTCDRPLSAGVGR